MSISPGNAPEIGPEINPEISVVIPHLNDGARLGTCLAALAAQQLAPGRFEVIVVDNGSAEPPRPVVERFPGVTLILEPAPGPGPARNRGILAARAPLVAFLDSDCIPDPGWLGELLAAFAADPGSGVLGGAVRLFAADPGRPNVAEAFDLVYGIRQELTVARHGFAATANLAVRREVFDAVGLFAGIRVSEDMEWGQRARGLGYPTRLAPRALVRHPARNSIADLRRQWDRHVSHFYAMQPRSLRGRAAWIGRALLIAASPAGEIPRVLGTDRLRGAKARLLAFAGVVRMRLYRARRMLAEMAASGAPQRSARWNRS